ncbi:ABC transporter substrate-binding protein [Clostridium sp. CM028]|uniref:ABC transporter substrate-binding protein n=1 Tax=unclassified Clostridium TaxID=2614128 RepID=UPI001C0D5EC9|nr:MULTISPECIES: ABC transporter substrate-binding protein [unclassified Clostridium]MBU3090856.1 ABC transporter substrate-binding protein [Clostridium sp. CF011]MBW9144577.1 ABC transporter substrate-binding protein [Clostridium sp. CM027]MBW9147897.1 ABC transporter substrate-binding protein [Clostridium sp. CM028]UVE40662.1 ABC transporter substrate-binding protein [Clostridium sp. CM027]WAG69629.1 ABC transporter substrate-binding protein [Clostridium sp. CF011]
MKKSLKNLCCVLIVLTMVFSFSSCKMDEKEKKLNIFLDTTDESSSKVIKLLIDDFKKNNPDVEVKLNDALGDKSDIMETINLGTEIDVIFTNRNKLIELSKNGVLSDMKDSYDDNTINNRYYNIMSSYGRVGDKYYGIGVVPYSIELLYNKANLEKLKISNPNNLEQWLNVLKQINGKGMKTPVVLTGDVDASGFLFSLIASKSISIHDVEEKYDSGEESYKKLKDVQGIFKEFDSLTKNNGITKDSFELGNEQNITGFNNGDSPLLVCISYYNSKLNGSNIGIIGDYENNSKYGSNGPIIINSLLSVPVNAKNGDNADAFIKYIYSDEVQARIVQKGIISGNKIANNKVTGIGKIMVQHIYKANDNNIPILYNLPDKLKNNVLLALKKILGGGYSSKEWEELLKESYK